MIIRVLQLSFVAALLFAQTETSAPLPNPLVMENGTRVTTTAQWRTARRPELLALFTREMYGVAPPRSPKESFNVFDNTPGALNGKAIRKQDTILLNGDPNGPKFDLLMYLPLAAKRQKPGDPRDEFLRQSRGCERPGDSYAAECAANRADCTGQQFRTMAARGNAR